MTGVPLLERAATQTRNGIRVTVSVPSDDESERLFGASLAAHGIQPVWLRIENGTEYAYWFAPLELDPRYFTPLEAANRARYRFSPGENQEMAAYFLSSAIRSYAGPGQNIVGWVFTTLDRGIKTVNVELIGPQRHEVFFFMLRIPGLRADYQEADLRALSVSEGIHSVNESALRSALEDLPCCATTENGRGTEDPLNFVLIGTPDDVFPSLARADWHVAEVLQGPSALRTFWSYFFGGRYRYAPISAVYLFGRRQDMSLQKTRETARERNHLRIWGTSLSLEGKRVWVGQISRDIGLSFSWSKFVAHEVDPDVDEARNYLLQDMLRTQRLSRFGWVKGVGRTPSSAPRYMDDGTPFFTDGLRAVMFFG
ncbi:MAG TPA: LssY C-terminal domain-containing protein, partial [Gemmatimonadaceae bacterium]|nr:LssY C-terminal domain-containing protein [Gemmatimonadaceae bacterium]